jgi:hypothetical protein
LGAAAVLHAEECQRPADEFARMARETVNPILLARYQQLHRSWLYLARLKTARPSQPRVRRRRVHEWGRARGEAETVTTPTMKSHIRWDDLGRPTKAGAYPCEGERVRVCENHIDLWQRYPEAAFKVIGVKSPNPAEPRYTLGLRDTRAE